MKDNTTGRVMEATWNWRSAGPSGDGTAAGLRRGAVIQSLVMAVIGLLLFVWLRHHLFARVVWALAGLVLVLGLAFPAAYRPIHAFGRILGNLVGKGLTHLLLVPFFYLFFTPVALILRAQGRDPLHRRFRDPQWTYWIDRTAKLRDENIEKQFLREDRDARSRRQAVAAPDRRQGSDRS